MTTVQRALRRTAAGIAIALTALALSATPALAADGPLLTVDVQAETHHVAVGSPVDYTVTVTNAGTDADGLVLQVEVPTGSTIERSSAGEPDGNLVSATIDIASGADEVVTVRVKPGEGAASEESLAVIASVFVDDAAAAPLVRNASVLPVAKVTETSAMDALVLPFGIAALLVIVVLLVIVLVVRNRRARRERGPVDDGADDEGVDEESADPSVESDSARS